METKQNKFERTFPMIMLANERRNTTTNNKTNEQKFWKFWKYSSKRAERKTIETVPVFKTSWKMSILFIILIDFNENSSWIVWDQINKRFFHSSFYRVIQNFHPPSRAASVRLSVNLTRVGWNKFSLNITCQTSWSRSLRIGLQTFFKKKNERCHFSRISAFFHAK